MQQTIINIAANLLMFIAGAVIGADWKQRETKLMKAFQCSTCANLQMADDKCMCHAAQPVPKYRDKSDRELCLEAYKPLPASEQWHEKFYWE